MTKSAKLIFVTALLMGCFLSNAFAQASLEDVTRLIKQAESYIKDGGYEQAESTLDQAFQAAKEAGDYESLMKIGDLYLNVDKSLGDKAMDAWTKAGKLKCR